MDQEMETLSLADTVRSQISSLPPRPGKGIQGRKYRLKTNFFKVKIKNDVDFGLIYHYDVKIFKTHSGSGGDQAVGPEEDRDSKRYKKLRLGNNLLVFEEMVRNNSNPGGYFYIEDLARPAIPVFDGVKNMYCKHKLPIEKQFDVPIEIEGQLMNYQVSIKLANAIDTEKLDRYRNTDMAPIPEPQDCLQALDIIVRHGPHMSMVPVGKSLYNRADQDQSRQNIRNSQQIAYGLYLSIQLVKASEVVVIDRSVTLLYKQCSVFEFLKDNLRQEQLRNISSLARDGARLLKGLEVRVNHLTYKRKYKVKDVTTQKTNELIITLTGEGENGREVTVAQFFLEKYQRKVDHNLPCLVVGSTARPNYLPMDVCELVPDQPVVRVSPAATQELIRVSARKKPQDRAEDLDEHCKNFRELSRKYREEFGIQVNTKPLTVEARQLPAPAITYANIELLRPVDGKWDIRNKTFLDSTSLMANEWMILCFDTNINKEAADGVKNRLSNGATRLGLQLGTRSIINGRQEDTRTEWATYVKGGIEALFDKKNKEHMSIGDGLKMIVCILPQNQDLYQEIKLVGDCKKFIVTQCIHSKNCNATRFNEQYVKNILLKINHKLGGTNHRLNVVENLPPAILRDNMVMVIGVDFTHPSAAEPSKTISTSICACVGSLDKEMTKWETSVRVHSGNAQQEMITEIGQMFKHLYRSYVKENSRFPDKVIVYRDGISDAQFRNVKNIELASIKNCFSELILEEELASLSDEPEPEVTFIIVQKRHRTRFVPEDKNDGRGPVGNVAPGTVVDQDVVSIQKFDFYLTSHEGIQGLSRPAHYTVIHDDMEISADEIQALTYHLAYCFSRCTRSISVPAPLAYANLAAARARHHSLISRGTEFNFKKFCTKDDTGTGTGLYFV